MNNTERIKQAEEMISKATAMIEEANKIIAEVKGEPTDVLAEYKNQFDKGGSIYFIGPYGEIETVKNSLDYDYAYRCDKPDPYTNYLSEEYARRASELAQFNNKLLAFKWCHDRDYHPVWYDGQTRYSVYYCIDTHKYCVAWMRLVKRNEVCFSSEEIAQKCCDWLNGELTKGDDE